MNNLPGSSQDSPCLRKIEQRRNQANGNKWSFGSSRRTSDSSNNDGCSSKTTTARSSVTSPPTVPKRTSSLSFWSRLDSSETLCDRSGASTPYRTQTLNYPRRNSYVHLNIFKVLFSYHFWC